MLKLHEKPRIIRLKITKISFKEYEGLINKQYFIIYKAICFTEKKIILTKITSILCCFGILCNSTSDSKKKKKLFSEQVKIEEKLLILQ